MTIKEWWYKERVGRFEEGTSQDFFPTNGDAVVYITLWNILPVTIFLVYILQDLEII